MPPGVWSKKGMMMKAYAATLLFWAALAAAEPVALGEAVRTVEQSLAAHPLAAVAGPEATARYAAGLVSSALAVYEQSRHLDLPAIFRTDAIDGRPGLVNPDNLYASALLAENGRYRIFGRRGSHAQLTLQIIDGYPNVTLGRNLAVVDIDALGIRAGEAFEVFLGGERRNGHWLPLPQESRALLIRQTFSDWDAEGPSVLSIERLDSGAPTVAASEVAATAGDYLLSAARTWNEGYLPRIQQLPVNRLPPPRPSIAADGGLAGQQSIMARYRLGADQALLITARKTDARYQGIQLGDPWFVTPNFIAHQVSLSQFQAVADADGRIRYVISMVDPGVANWLDPAGFAEGYVFMRWQGLSHDLGAQDAPTAELLSLSDLQARLPPDTSRLTAAERKSQLARRSLAPIRKR